MGLETVSGAQTERLQPAEKLASNQLTFANLMAGETYLPAAAAASSSAQDYLPNIALTSSEIASPAATALASESPALQSATALTNAGLDLSTVATVDAELQQMTATLNDISQLSAALEQYLPGNGSGPSGVPADTSPGATQAAPGLSDTGAEQSAANGTKAAQGFGGDAGHGRHEHGRHGGHHGSGGSVANASEAVNQSSPISPPAESVSPPALSPPQNSESLAANVAGLPGEVAATPASGPAVGNAVQPVEVATGGTSGPAVGNAVQPVEVATGGTSGPAVGNAVQPGEVATGGTSGPAVGNAAQPVEVATGGTSGPAVGNAVQPVEVATGGTSGPAVGNAVQPGEVATGGTSGPLVTTGDGIAAATNVSASGTIGPDVNAVQGTGGPATSNLGNWTTETLNGNQYEVMLPQNYNPSEQYPVVMYLHQLDMGTDWNNGSGANDIQSEITPWFNSLEQQTPSIVVVPLLNQTSDPSGDTLNFGGITPGDNPGELQAMDDLKQVMTEYSADPAQVYVTGASMGGQGAEDMMVKYNDENGTEGKVFAGAVTFAGGVFDYGPITSPDQSVIDQEQNVPIWSVHGQDDTEVPPQWDESMAAAEAALGSTTFKYTEVAGAGHDVWDGSEGYSNPQYFNWLMQQAAPNPTTFQTQWAADITT